MNHSKNRSTRRGFFGKGLQLGAGGLFIDASLSRAAAQAPPSESIRSDDWPDGLPNLPPRVYIDHEGGRPIGADKKGSRFTSSTTAVEISPTSSGTKVGVHCPTGMLARVILRWDLAFPGETLYLGDHWERGYGDLQWRTLQPERVMPWYFAAHRLESRDTFMAGVETQPAAMCFWTVDAVGIALWLDFRNGGLPCHPGDRTIAAATIHSQSTRDQSPMSALTEFCRILSPKPRLAKNPICGNNNWYYAYGEDFDAAAMRRDAQFLAELADGHSNLPFCVIDAGWTPGSACPGGPWKEGDGVRFPDMPGLAADMKRLGVRPGVWMRPTALTVVKDKTRLRAGPVDVPEKPLDLTMPENLELIHEDVARVGEWGYELIKHDFSTFDLFGKWGFEMGGDLTESGWGFYDRSLTNAEILMKLYRTLRDAAGDAILLGCNTVGHLAAGFFEIQRTGDDTSGRVWERTRRMGVNTLAFRQPQHQAFFACDADCAAHTEKTPWEYDRQFLDLVARSGTALFVSVDPRTVTAEQKSAFRAAMQVALSGGEPGGAEPLDWLHTTCPREWRISNDKVTYNWEEDYGAYPLRV